MAAVSCVWPPQGDHQPPTPPDSGQTRETSRSDGDEGLPATWSAGPVPGDKAYAGPRLATPPRQAAPREGGGRAVPGKEAVCAGELHGWGAENPACPVSPFRIHHQIIPPAGRNNSHRHHYNSGFISTLWLSKFKGKRSGMLHNTSSTKMETMIPQTKFKAFVFFSFSFLFEDFICFVYLKREWAGARGRETLRQTRCWAQSVPPWEHDLSSNGDGKLNWLSHPGSPRLFISWPDKCLVHKSCPPAHLHGPEPHHSLLTPCVDEDRVWNQSCLS